MMPDTTTTSDFKDTEIGPIPVDWEVAELQDVVEFSRKPRGLDLNSFDIVPFVPMEFIPEDGVKVSHELRHPDDVRSGTYCEAGDFLLAKITPSFENGKQGMLLGIPLDFAYATTEVYAMHAKPKYLVQMFLFYFFKRPSVRADLTGKMEGSTGRQRIPKAVVERYMLPLPPLDEQRKIAHVLNTIQAEIAAQDDVIAAAQEAKRSLMAWLFTYGPGPGLVSMQETRFGDVPEHWQIVPLNECAYVQTGVAKGRELGEEPTIEVPYLRVANVQDGYLDLSEIKQIVVRERELERYSLQPGDVVLTEGGDFDKLGRGFIWNGQIEPCVHQNHIFAVRTNHEVLQPEFLAYLAQSDYGKAYFLTVAHRTTNLASINSTKLKALPVLIPPMGEQQEIVEMLRATDYKVSAERDRKAALQALFQSMLHELMSGRVRVHNTQF